MSERVTVTPEMSRIAHGASWSVAGTVATQVLSFATTIVAARALAPDVFGVVGMGAVAVGVAASIRDFGLSPAIASGRVADDKTLWTAHWLILALGVAITALLVAVAPLVGHFFGNARVIPALRIQALTIVLGSLVVVPTAIIQRAGRFARLAAIGTLAQALTLAGVAIGAALGAGVWTLVLPGLAAGAVTVPLFWLTAGRLPSPVFAREKVRVLVHEGLRVAGSSFCNFLTRNADNATIGRINGEVALGLYGFAYSFLMQPLGMFSHAFIPVLLPAFGRLEDAARRSDGVVRTVLALLRLGTPFMVGGALTASLFVPAIFGPRWIPAVPLVQILMLLGAVQIIGPVFGTLSLTLGEATFVLRFGVWTTAAAVLTFIAGALVAGPVGVATGYFLYTLGVIGVMYRVARGRFGLPLEGLGTGIARIVRDLAVMAVVVLTVDQALQLVFASTGVRLATEVCAGALAYVGAFRVWSAAEARLLLSLMPLPVGRLAARALRLPVT